MNSISAQKTRGFLSSPRTYPKGGLGLGVGAGAISVTTPKDTVGKNRLNAKGTLAPVKPVTSQPVLKNMKTDFHMKAAELKGKSMLEKIKQLAMEKCAGDEQKAQEFLEGFYEELLTKQAAGFEVGHLIKEFSGGIGKGLAGVTLGLGVAGLTSAAKSISSDRMRTEFTQALAKAITSNPIIRQAKKEKVISYAETIFKFAPHVACDSNILSSVLAHVVQGEGVDTQIIKMLTDLEARYTMTATSTTFTPKSYV